MLFINTFVEWEEQLTQIVQDREECTRGDAQGIIEAKPVELYYNDGLTPEQAASKILS